jgi:hypothetical protein
MNVGMGQIQKSLELGDVKCFQEDVDRVLWFKVHLVVPKKIFSFIARSWMKLIALDIPSI